VTVVLVLVLVSACAAPTKTDIKLEEATEPLQATQEAVVIFPTYRARSEVHEKDFMHCVKQELEKVISGRIKIVDRETFQDALFPWFEPQYSPSDAQELNSLVSRQLVRDRIASLGVRYLVNIASTATSDGFPGMFCGGGYGGAGCLGLSWEDKIHKVDAVIFDIVKGTQAGTLSVKSSGRSLAFAFVVPVIFVAYTEREACKALAIELSRLLIDKPGNNQ
jgi:hypothetical protein